MFSKLYSQTVHFLKQSRMSWEGKNCFSFCTFWLDSEARKIISFTFYEVIFIIFSSYLNIKKFQRYLPGKISLLTFQVSLQNYDILSM